MSAFLRITSRPIIAAASEANKVATFEASAYNGGELVLPNYDLPVVIDLAGLTAGPQIVANWDHDPAQPVGHVAEVVNDGARLVLRGSLSHAGNARDMILQSARDGFPYQASVEVRPAQVDRIAAGASVSVNGQEFTGPIYVARSGLLYGVAFVPLGADMTTSISIAARRAPLQPIKGGMIMDFAQWAASMGVDVAKLDDAKKAELMKAYEAMSAGAKPDAKAEASDAPESAAPTTVAAGNAWDATDIRAAHADALDSIDERLLEVEPDASADILAGARKKARKELLDLKAKATRGRWSVDRYQANAEKILAGAALEVVRGARPTGPAIHASHRDRPTSDIVAAAVCQRVGLRSLEKQFKPETLEAADREFHGRIGLQQLIIEAAAANGMTIRAGSRLHDGNLREALEYAFPRRDIRATNFSGISLSGILSNVANKELLEGFMEEDATWREIATVKTVSDFKTVTSYRMLDDLSYELIPKGGKLPHGTLSDTSYTRKVRTYAKMFALTREDIINDDLGALDDLRDRIGRGAATKLNDLFWATFLDNSSFFTTGNTNYISGTTTNLGTDGVGLGLGVKAFRTMTTSSADGSKRVGGPPPEILLVPPELEAVADQLYQARNIGAVKVSDTNTYAGKYRPVVCPWLSDTSVTGYSTTAWYLFRRPTSGMAPVVVSFLNNQQTPTVETSDADFDQLGIQFRGYHDFGVDLFEPLAGIKSKGAA